MRRNLVKLIFIPAILFTMIFLASPVLACSPSQEAMNLTLEDRVENAPMILVGTIVGGVTSSYGNRYEVIREADVEVEQYLRGEGPAIVHISGFGDGADCNSSVRMGERAIFMVSGDHETGLQANYTGVHDAVWQASDSNIALIRGMTGESNTPEPLPITTQLQRFVTEYALWIIGIIILLTLATAIVLWKRTRDPRKSKAKRS